MAGLLKRKFDQLDEDSSLLSSSSSSSLCSSGGHSRSCSPTSSVPLAWDSDQEGPWDQVPLPVHDFCGPQSLTSPSILKRSSRKRPGRVAFDGITVFYFTRCQGFTSVPSRGGCTLGMAPHHNACRHFSMAEFTLEQAQARQEKLRLRLKEEKLEVLRWQQPDARVPLTVEAIDDASVEEDLAMAVAGGRLEEMTCLKPYPARKRRALLRAAGVRWIDREEKHELQALRQSREDCGCRCDRVCDPETCSCSLAGIKCQMDHTAFPCGCCKEGCENPEGRVEFNQARVQTHFIHTLTRLQLEQGAESLRELEAPTPGAPASPGEQALDPTLTLTKPPANSELGDSSCSSDMTASSAASGSSEALSGPAHPALPGPGLQPSMADDSLARILSFSPSDLGGEDEEEEDEEEEEEERGMGNLDNLSCFHPADFFGTGDPVGLASWTHSYSGLPAGLLDENANLDASCFLNSGLECSGGDGLPGSTGPPGTDTGHSSSVDLSLSSCDSLELLQALPDYSLGPHHSARKVTDSPDHLEAHLFPLPAFSPPSDTSTCFLESILGLSEPPADAMAPLMDSPLLEDPAPASLVEPVPV